MCNCGANIALKKPTFQSSTGWGGDSSRAVDGVRDPMYFNNHLTHTNNESNPWWAVDLGFDATVRLVKLTNRAEGLGYRLHNFIVAVSDKSPATTVPNQYTYSVIGTYSGAVRDGATVEINCSGVQGVNNKGRYLIIQMPGVDLNYLTIGDVEVYQ